MQLKLFCISQLFLVGYANTQAQNVTLNSRQFFVNGNPFYPVAMNYVAEVSSPTPGTTTWQSNGYVTPYVEYNVNLGPSGNQSVYECTDPGTCDLQLKADFDYMAGMGFNTIRVANFGPTYDPSLGLVWKGRDHPALNFFYIPLDPNTPNDPGMQFVLARYEDLLVRANNTINPNTGLPHPMKLIFIMTGQGSFFPPAELNAINDFIRKLAIYMAGSPNKNALMAYDLWNEPGYSDQTNRTKEEACNIIQTFYNTIHDHDPDHLVTIGSSGLGDLFDYDPGIIKVDFLSLHIYPQWADFEDRTLPFYQDLARQRVVNEFYWATQNLPCAWIIGETGFHATGNPQFANIMAEGLHGTLADQQDFVNYTLDAVCNCGGSGYSWWDFQDGYYYDISIPGAGASRFWGVLERGYTPALPAEKPAVNNAFRPYVKPVTATCGPCPVSYNPNYDASLTYYDPYRSSDHNTTFTNAVSGVVKDQNNQPIKDAYIIGLNWVETIDFDQIPNNGNEKPINKWIKTFSDQNGYFQLIPYNYKLIGDNRITGLKGSVAGGETFEKGQLWPPSETQMQTNVGTIILNKVNRFYNSVISNEWIDFGQSKNFAGWNSIETFNTTIEGNGNTGGNANFTARQEVHLTSEFEAKKGCEAHFYISETFADCGDYSTFQTVYKPTGALSLSPEKSREDISLQFQIPLQDIVIIPNPNSGGLKLTLTTETTDQRLKITIQNVHGKKVRQFLMDKKELFIDLSVLAKGIYFLSVSGNTSLETKKLIVQ